MCLLVQSNHRIWHHSKKKDAIFHSSSNSSGQHCMFYNKPGFAGALVKCMVECTKDFKQRQWVIILWNWLKLHFYNLSSDKFTPGCKPCNKLLARSLTYEINFSEINLTNMA